jgi:hypothetical protein
MVDQGNPRAALEYARRAHQDADYLGYIYGQSYSAFLQARCQTAFANYRHAENLLKDAGELLISCGLAANISAIRSLEAEIHLVKTQYLKSRQIQASIVATIQPATFNAIMTNLYIAHVDITLGADSKLILERLKTCQTQCKALSGVRNMNTKHMVQTGFAILHLREGDYDAANLMFA